jgi:sugar/nucleoside kinase (ribokinase family)
MFFSCGAYPLEDIHDPTGAGDTFAGGLAGYLASRNEGEITFEKLRRAVVYGSVLASYNVEAFSLERMRSLTIQDVEHRYQMFKLMSHFEVLE